MANVSLCTKAPLNGLVRNICVQAVAVLCSCRYNEKTNSLSPEGHKESFKQLLILAQISVSFA